jgi:2-methylisocitrate lyase-like PEP mutase family enzyme
MGFGIRARSTTPLVAPSVLEKLGVAVVEYPRMLTAAAVRGMQRALAAFAEGVKDAEVVEHPDLLISFDEICDLMGLPEIRELEERYLTEAQLLAKYGQPSTAV